MNRNEFSKKAHVNAAAKGFWREKMGNEHCLMLVVTEISEMVEADRLGKKADKFGFDTAIANARNGVVRDDWFTYAFNRCIKNSLEDELADVAIRLADLAGALGVDFDKLHPCRYYRAFDRFSFTENAFALVKGLSRDRIAIEKRIQFGLDFIEAWATQLEINLAWHVEQKMRYNEAREAMHGKKY